MKKNEEEKREWIKTTWEYIKKKLRSGTTVIFLDESGYSLIPFVTRTWALKGEVPALYHSWMEFTEEAQCYQWHCSQI